MSCNIHLYKVVSGIVRIIKIILINWTKFKKKLSMKGFTFSYIQQNQIISVFKNVTIKKQIHICIGENKIEYIIAKRVRDAFCMTPTTHDHCRKNISQQPTFLRLLRNIALPYMNCTHFLFYFFNLGS